ncbi:unannotated protein [freshwater metagenome]|uniref:Unannotated protein n=1 Tax=freshwater metagenome TaxID=449393 RepID=A0A6J7SLU2_9ZZZZ
MCAGNRAKGVGDAQQHEAEGQRDADHSVAGTVAVCAYFCCNAKDGSADGKEDQKEGADSFGNEFSRQEIHQMLLDRGFI